MFGRGTLASFNTFCDLLRATASFTRMCTFSARARCRTISAYTHGIGWNRPGQSAGLCGHAIQVAACGSHSAGMRKPSAAGVASSLSKDFFGTSVYESVRDISVAINAAIAQERPVSPHFLQVFQIDLPDQNFFLVVRSLRQHSSEWIAQ